MTSAVETQGEARPVESEVPMAQRQGHRESSVEGDAGPWDSGSGRAAGRPWPRGEL